MNACTYTDGGTHKHTHTHKYKHAIRHKHITKTKKKYIQLGLKVFYKNSMQGGMGLKKYRNKEGMKEQEDYPAAEKSW